MKSLEEHLKEEFTKEGFFIPGMPREIDCRAIETAQRAVRLCLEEWFAEQKFDSYESGFSAIHWYQAIKDVLIPRKEDSEK